MANFKNEIILLDSDSESDGEPAPKKSRLSAQAAVAQAPAKIPPMKKPFMEESDGESPESTGSSPRGESGESGESATESLNEDMATQNPKLHGNTGALEDENSSSDSFDGRTTTPPLMENSRQVPASQGFSFDEFESDESVDFVEISDSDFEISTADGNRSAENEARKRSVYEARRYLKNHGKNAFLQRYAPEEVTFESLVELISRLGFAVTNLPPEINGVVFEKLMRILHAAIEDVQKFRPRLENFDSVPDVLNALRKAKKILIITGAGISTSLGIPDFRSSEGFYSKMSSFGVDDPQDVFNLDVFRSEPALFYSIAHMILPPTDVKAPLHMFLRMLQDKGKLLRNYTQNIDNIEANAGIRPESMVQCHGSLAGATCITCKYHTKGEELFPAMRKSEIAYCPKCKRKREQLMRREEVTVEESYGVMKPDITFFGEDLPRSFHEKHKQDLNECDLLISIGTSLRVSPVSNMVQFVPPNVPQILINRDPLPYCNFDVSLLGYCDDVVSYLCDQLGREWDINHPDYKKIVGDDHKNLKVYDTEERGVFHVRNKTRDLEEASKPKRALPEPDLVELEPSVN